MAPRSSPGSGDNRARPLPATDPRAPEVAAPVLAPAESEGAWQALTAAARQVQGRAYAPYSGFSVGAAAFTAEGHLVRGCNVENASYGLSQCAERGLVSDLVLAGGGRLRRLVVVGPDGEPLAPCGGCRQVLSEHSGPDTEILRPGGPIPLLSLLPDAFGPGDLAR